MKTFLQRKEDVQRSWYHVDAEGQILGRLASRVAVILMGKHKPTFTPGVDGGDFVVVTNAKKVQVTGRKEENKLYRRHTGYIGHFIEEPLSRVRASKRPERLIQLAVRRMLPKNTLGGRMLKRLKVYAGPEHPHAAQNPKPLGLAAKKR